MTSRATTRSIRAALAAVVMSLSITGCGGSGPSEASCTGFALSLTVDGGGAATPAAAAAKYAREQGHLPTQGWTTVDSADDGVSLQSGESRLHAVKLRDGTWIVDSGRRC